MKIDMNTGSAVIQSKPIVLQVISVVVDNNLKIEDTFIQKNSVFNWDLPIVCIILSISF